MPSKIGFKVFLYPHWEILIKRSIQRAVTWLVIFRGCQRSLLHCALIAQVVAQGYSRRPSGAVSLELPWGVIVGISPLYTRIHGNGISLCHDELNNYNRHTQVTPHIHCSVSALFECVCFIEIWVTLRLITEEENAANFRLFKSNFRILIIKSHRTWKLSWST